MHISPGGGRHARAARVSPSPAFQRDRRRVNNAIAVASTAADDVVAVVVEQALLHSVPTHTYAPHVEVAERLSPAPRSTDAWVAAFHHMQAVAADTEVVVAWDTAVVVVDTLAGTELEVQAGMAPGADCHWMNAAVVALGTSGIVVEAPVSTFAYGEGV